MLASQVTKALAAQERGHRDFFRFRFLSLSLPFLYPPLPRAMLSLSLMVLKGSAREEYSLCSFLCHILCASLPLFSQVAQPEFPRVDSPVAPTFISYFIECLFIAFALSRFLPSGLAKADYSLAIRIPAFPTHTALFSFSPS